jgi:hypothetical protein
LPDRAFELFDEFVVRFRRGEEPDLSEYLARAGTEADELARLADRFLQAAPPPAPTEDVVVLARAWVCGEPPLLELRVKRGLKRGQVVDSLHERLDLAPELRGKLNERYHELETGQLEPAPVDRRVWEALAAALRTRVEDLTSWARPVPPLETRVMYRAMPASSAPALRQAREQRREPDEVDRLFGLS